MAHFELHKMRLDGTLTGEIVKCETVTGVILNTPIISDKDTIEHRCALARETPNYPIDLDAWLGEGEHRRMVWNARLIYQNGVTDDEY